MLTSHLAMRRSRCEAGYTVMQNRHGREGAWTSVDREQLLAEGRYRRSQRERGPKMESDDCHPHRRVSRVVRVAAGHDPARPCPMLPKLLARRS